MVMRGRVRRHAAQRGIHRIPMLFQHDPSEPVGVWLELREDHRGLLRARAADPGGDARARAAVAAARRRHRRAVDRLSHREGHASIRGPASAAWWRSSCGEISIVTFPLLAGARVRAVKQAASSSQPKASFARTRAERDWRALMGGGGRPKGGGGGAARGGGRRGGGGGGAGQRGSSNSKTQPPPDAKKKESKQRKGDRPPGG